MPRLILLFSLAMMPIALHAQEAGQPPAVPQAVPAPAPVEGTTREVWFDIKSFFGKEL